MGRDSLEIRACRGNHFPLEKDHCRELDGHAGESISETDGICQADFLLCSGRAEEKVYLQ